MPAENVFADITSYDLIGKNNQEIIKRLKDMNFNAIVGNPPYQDQGGSGGNNDAPIYQEFCSIANTITTRMSSLVIKAAWFSVGRENLLSGFRNEMLTSKQVRRLVTYSNSREIFPNVEIKGGICYYLKDKEYIGLCDYVLIKDGKSKRCERNLDDFDILIREPILNMIVRKVSEISDAEGVKKVDTIISSDTPFGIPSNPKTSKKTPFDVSSTKDKYYDISLFYIEKLHRKVGYCSREQIKKNAGDIPYDKVFVPCSGGSGNDKMVLGVPELAPKNSVCSQSYLYAKFNSTKEGANFMSYIKTKFFRMLVSAIKITQACPKKVYRFVPLQDFTSKSDIDWGKSVAEIDRQLYAKYKLSEEETAFIESMIKPM